MPEQLADAPDLPETAALIWEVFCEISQYRGNNGDSENPISPTGIKDWCWMNTTVLEPWERRVIAQLDKVYLSRKQK